jgi:hypothetical protein
MFPMPKCTFFPPFSRRKFPMQETKGKINVILLHLSALHHRKLKSSFQIVICAYE